MRPPSFEIDAPWVPAERPSNVCPMGSPDTASQHPSVPSSEIDLSVSPNTLSKPPPSDSSKLSQSNSTHNIPKSGHLVPATSPSPRAGSNPIIPSFPQNKVGKKNKEKESLYQLFPLGLALLSILPNYLVCMMKHFMHNPNWTLATKDGMNLLETSWSGLKILYYLQSTMMLQRGGGYYAK